MPVPLVRRIEHHPTSEDVPTTPIVIAACGVLSSDDPSLKESASPDGDTYEDYPEDDPRAPDDHEYAYTAANSIKSIGNALLTGKNEDGSKAGDPNPTAALEKYLSMSSYPLRLDHDPLTWRPLESLRYLDEHHALPDDAPPQRKDEFDELRTVLLINSALAALRAQPPDPTLAVHQTTRAHLLAVKIEHKGWSCPLFDPAHVFTGVNRLSESTLPPGTGQGGLERRRRRKGRLVGSQQPPRDRRPPQPQGSHLDRTRQDHAAREGKEREGKEGIQEAFRVAQIRTAMLDPEQK